LLILTPLRKVKMNKPIVSYTGSLGSYARVRQLASAPIPLWAQDIRREDPTLEEMQLVKNQEAADLALRSSFDLSAYV